jgi:hypothetical protein
MTMPATQARPRATGRLILRRVFDVPHPRPQPHLTLRSKPPGNEPTPSLG